MNIIVAHNRYQIGGGEDTEVRDEVEVLRARGHAVRLLEVDNDGIQGLRGRLTAAASAVVSRRSRALMAAAIREHRPELVHVHNWFPMLSPSVHAQADADGIAIVQTLQNFRMLCANALLFRDGAVCTECVGKALPWGGVIHACYRGSRAGSAVVTAAFALHRLARTWDKVDRFIAVSAFQRDLLVKGGLPADRLTVKPNHAAVTAPPTPPPIGDHALYAGRLSPEKGLRTLLAAWGTGRLPMGLKVIGDGPLEAEVRAHAASNPRIEVLGRLPSEAVYREMARARFLVFPSEWYETFGRTMIEAFAQGTPVLAADIGGARELVEDGVTGYRYEAGNPDALAAGALRFAPGAAYEAMRAACRRRYQSDFTADVNYGQLMAVYAQAIEARRLKSRGA